MLGPEAIFDPVSAHPDMLFGNAACGAPVALTSMGPIPALESRHHPFGPHQLRMPATTDRASLISVTVEAIATLGTVP
jgi:hypothetical protein